VLVIDGEVQLVVVLFFSSYKVVIVCDITQKAFEVMQVLVVECNTISVTIGGNNCFVLNKQHN